jgi:hypothetical protein
VGLERQPDEQQERGGRSGCRVIAQVAKATAMLARDVALEPALLPGKGRTQTAQAGMMGETGEWGKLTGSLGWQRRNGRKNNAFL